MAEENTKKKSAYHLYAPLSRTYFSLYAKNPTKIIRNIDSLRDVVRHLEGEAFAPQGGGCVFLHWSRTLLRHDLDQRTAKHGLR